jgi:hypothetical protein
MILLKGLFCGHMRRAESCDKIGISTIRNKYCFYIVGILFEIFFTWTGKNFQ